MRRRRGGVAADDAEGGKGDGWRGGSGAKTALQTEVDDFIRANNVDEKAADVLRQCLSKVQEAVIQRGDLGTAHNPSSALLARIRDAQTGSMKDTRGGGSGGPTRRMGSSGDQTKRRAGMSRNDDDDGDGGSRRQDDGSGRRGEQWQGQLTEKERHRLEDWFLAVKLLLTWDDTKNFSAEDMEQKMGKFLLEDAQKFRIAARLSTELFIRGVLRAIWDIDRLLRQTNPGNDLKRYSKNSSVLSVLRVLAFELMFTPSITARAIVNAAHQLMDMCGMNLRAERQWISEAVSRMRNSFEKGHQEIDKKRKSQEEKKKLERGMPKDRQPAIRRKAAMAAVAQARPAKTKRAAPPPAPGKRARLQRGVMAADLEEEDEGEEGAEVEEVTVSKSEAAKAAEPATKAVDADLPSDGKEEETGKMKDEKSTKKDDDKEEEKDVVDIDDDDAEDERVDSPQALTRTTPSKGKRPAWRKNLAVQARKRLKRPPVEPDLPADGEEAVSAGPTASPEDEEVSPEDEDAKLPEADEVQDLEEEDAAFEIEEAAELIDDDKEDEEPAEVAEAEKETPEAGEEPPQVSEESGQEAAELDEDGDDRAEGTEDPKAAEEEKPAPEASEEPQEAGEQPEEGPKATEEEKEAAEADEVPQQPAQEEEEEAAKPEAEDTRENGVDVSSVDGENAAEKVGGTDGVEENASESDDLDEDALLQGLQAEAAPPASEADNAPEEDVEEAAAVEEAKPEEKKTALVIEPDTEQAAEPVAEPAAKSAAEPEPALVVDLDDD